MFLNSCPSEFCESDQQKDDVIFSWISDVQKFGGSETVIDL